MLISLALWISVAVGVVVVSDDVKSKRLILHNDEAVAAAIQTMSADIQQMTAKMAEQEQSIADLKSNLTMSNQKLTMSNQKLADSINAVSNIGHGSTYIRWGRTVCKGNGTELVYKGFAAGNWYSTNGGAADFICLPQDPIWGVYDDSQQRYSAIVYGVEYEFGEMFSDGGAKFFGQNMYEHDVPCAMCHSSHPVSVMIPGRNQCYPGWTMEYSGYLVSGRYGVDSSATNYACLDVNAEVEFGDVENKNGKLMVLVEASCGALKCPPYVQNRELTCVVCSK